MHDWSKFVGRQAGLGMGGHGSRLCLACLVLDLLVRWVVDWKFVWFDEDSGKFGLG